MGLETDLYTYPRDLKCYVDGVGFLDLVGYERQVSERFHYWKFSATLKRACNPTSAEFIYDHELVSEKNIIDGPRDKGSLLVMEYCCYEH